MKTSCQTPKTGPAGAFATVAVLAILAIMCLLLMVNADSVQRAFREVRLVEQRQLQQHPWLVTNNVVPAPPR